MVASKIVDVFPSAVFDVLLSTTLDFTKGLNYYDWGGCTLSTSRGLILKEFGRSANKMETCVSLQLAPDALPPSSRKRKKATPPFSDWKSWRLTLLLDKHIDFSKWTLQSEVAPFLGKPRRKFSNMKTILQPYWCQFKKITGVDLSFW